MYSSITQAAVMHAMASRTPESIEAAQKAFIDEGTTMPAALLELLHQRYYDSLRPIRLRKSVPYITSDGLLLLAQEVKSCMDQ